MRDTASITTRISLCAIALAFAQGAAAADIAPSALSPRTEMKAVAPASAFAPNSPVAPAHSATGAASAKPNDSPNSRNAHAVNANVFSADDRAIIIVGGKQVTAGDVKREFKAELARKSGPPTVYKVAARKQATEAAVSTPAVAASANVRSGMAPRSTIGNAGFASAVNQRAHSPSALDPSTKVIALPDSVGSINDNRYDLKLPDCKKLTPEITQLRGSVASGQKFMIYGNCLGAQTGAVEIIGQFPNGNVRVAFDKWAEDAIEVVMPAVRGAADHVVAITVVRNGDNARSPAKQANFHAARERVEVPVVDWNPAAYFMNIGVDEGGGNIFGGYKVFGSGTGSYSANFRVAVPAACYLDNMEAQSQTGSVQQINGWENGPPNVANVQIVWSPVCTTTTTNYIVASSSQRVCSVAFNLKAWAQCPAGIAP
jgi:hypothetical protein